jgi:hypothetical protein
MSVQINPRRAAPQADAEQRVHAHGNVLLVIRWWTPCAATCCQWVSKRGGQLAGSGVQRVERESAHPQSIRHSQEEYIK